MIPILFSPISTSFDNFGLGHLIDTTSCEVKEERNGPFELTLKYPVTGYLYDKIKKEAIILAKPNDMANNQAFRIYKVSIPINGVVTINAQHISYDLINIAVKPFNLENVSPTQAGDYLLNNAVIRHNFRFQSDFSGGHDFKSDLPTSIRSLIGGSKGSILDLWGGEFEWDNYVIKHKAHRGSDNGVVISYGKNLTKLDQDSSIEDVYTHVLPYGVQKDDETGEEEIITLPEAVLPINETILETGKVYIKDFTDEFGTYERVTEYALSTKPKLGPKCPPRFESLFISPLLISSASTFNCFMSRALMSVGELMFSIYIFYSLVLLQQQLSSQSHSSLPVSTAFSYTLIL